MVTPKRLIWAPAVGRVLLGALFLIAGIRKVTNIEGVTGMIDGLGLPLPMLVAIVVMAVEIGAGVMLILGYYARLAALALGIFTLLTLAIIHNSFDDEMLLKNIAIIGGMLYVLAYGAGPLSVNGAPTTPRVESRGADPNVTQQ